MGQSSDTKRCGLGGEGRARGSATPGNGKPAKKGLAEATKTKTRANQDSVSDEMERERTQGEEG